MKKAQTPHSLTCSPMYTFRKFWKNPSTAMSSRCLLFSWYRCICTPASISDSKPNTRAARSPSMLSWLSALLLLLLSLHQDVKRVEHHIKTVQD